MKQCSLKCQMLKKVNRAPNAKGIVIVEVQVRKEIQDQ